ncbi:MAG: fructose-bisphosphate aldolase [Pseudomonadota bacterium]|jgi:class I fructose-bisphosphate aldolase
MNTIQKILSYYESDNAGVKANLARILMHGKLAGTGKMMILPVDQGFEHGPERSFAPNKKAYDPHYEFELAIKGGFNAYAAPLGMIEAGASTFAGQVPLILKMNSSNSLLPKGFAPQQAITASVNDALRLGCSAIGFTIYPGSSESLVMMEQIRELAEEAKSVGLAVVVWSYARGEDLSKEDEVSVDVISYAAHMATLLGAHIIKVKPPIARLAKEENKKAYEKNNIEFDTLEKRITIVKRSCFAGRRLVVFSGGEAKTEEAILEEISSIAKGGGDGSIVGRNMFQREFHSAVELAKKIANIYD